MITKFENYILEKKSDYIIIDGIQRSIVNSNGEFISDSEDNIRKFYEWFGDSKIIDSKGRPLVVYHGTRSVFNVFKPSKKIGNQGETDQIQGMYFTDNINGASFFSNSNDPKYLKSVYLSIQNPYISDSIKSLKESLNLDYLGDVADKVKSMGYDGLIIEKGFYAYGGPHKKLITFLPNQIKSTENKGNFNINDDSIYESIKNVVHAKSVIREILKEIQKITPTIKRSNVNFHDYSKMYWTLEIRWLDIKCKKDIDKLLKKKQEELLKTGMVLSFRVSEHPIMKFKNDDIFDFEPSGINELWYEIYLKDLYTKRFVPGKYLYHSSSKDNRSSILKHGLRLTEFNQGNWTMESFKNYYPPSVFATTEQGGWYKSKDFDIWRIDLTGLKNKWWEDLNFYEHLRPNKKDVMCLMTFDPIPPENLFLIHKSWNEYD